MSIQQTRNLHSVLSRHINFDVAVTWMEQAQILFTALLRLGAKKCISAAPQLMDADVSPVVIRFEDADGIRKWLVFNQNGNTAVSVDCPE